MLIDVQEVITRKDGKIVDRKVYRPDEKIKLRKGQQVKRKQISGRKLQYRDFFYVPGGEEPKISMINLWNPPSNIKKCSWATNYFGIYIPKRDGNLSVLQVRVNGKEFHPKPGSRSISDYLKDAKVVSKAPKFIKYPDWAPQIIGGEA